MKTNFGQVKFSVNGPSSLLKAVFSYVGKHFCIRGGEEQRSLKPSQYLHLHDPECYEYTEHRSKGRCGSLGQLALENKSVPCLAMPENRLVCICKTSISVNSCPLLMTKLCFTAPQCPISEGTP
jgi:hypothetical protein